MKTISARRGILALAVSAAALMLVISVYASCSETDGGRVSTVQGTTYSSNLGTNTDTCEGDTLTEYYCSGQTGYSKNYKCVDGCENGKCITSTCSETDGGRVSTEKGTTYSSNLGTNTDTCEGDTLTEYYCSWNRGYSKNIKCVDGCENGACEKPSCSETDDGRDQAQRGTIYSNNLGTQTDVCKDSYYLTEYYCSGNRGYSKNIKCPDGCTNGACEEESDSDYCTDSDKGKKYNIRGTTSDDYESETDTCSDTTYLTEYYCSGGDMKSGSYKCPDGCSNGACREASCDETDDGKDYTQEGTIYSNNLGTKTDYCKDSTYLTEYYCSGNRGYSITKKCIDGCSAGACEEESDSYYCYDTDGGRDYTEQGTVRLNSKTKTDKCTSTKTLTEYYCSGNKVYSEKILCDYDCSAGACESESDSYYCSDSDGGKKFTVKGTVTSDEGTSTDYCAGVTLVEYYCSGNKQNDMLYACQYGCKGGACITESPDYCSDSDGGKEYYTSGGISSYNLGSKYDICSDTTYLTEYYCSDKKGYSVTKKCDGGCSYDACKTTTTTTTTTRTTTTTLKSKGCPTGWGSEWTCSIMNGKHYICKNNGADGCWCSKTSSWPSSSSDWVYGSCTTASSSSWTCYSDWRCYDEGSRVKAVKGASVVCTYDKTGARNSQNVNWFGC